MTAEHVPSQLGGISEPPRQEGAEKDSAKQEENENYCRFV
jgi:hypothetical protein